MPIHARFTIRSDVLKDRVNKYAILGLGISCLSILMASILVSYQMTGFIHFEGIILAQKTNPGLWALDLTPFIFAYWGQLFCYELASTVEKLIEVKTRDLENKSSDLELKLEYETNHDHLTNLPSQRLLSQRINQGIKRLREKETLAVILLQINSFKDINFQYGNFNANSLLIQFAEKLNGLLFEPYLLQAYMGINLVARVQGSEFAVLIPRLRADHHLEEIIKKIQSSMSGNFMIDGNSIYISTTAGVALSPAHGTDDTSLIKCASSSLFYAQKEGKSYAIFHEPMDKNLEEKHVIQEALRHAIENATVDVLYEPEFELTKGTIIGAELFLNLKDKKYGTMEKDAFLQFVEGTSLARKLTVLMLRNALHQLALWHQANHKIYITVSLYDATDEGLPTYIAALLKDQKISPEYLKLELTEKICLNDQSRSIVVLKQLAELGIKVVISDFCSGYSSFVYLTTFPISEVKIDPSFVMNMLLDQKKLSIVQAVAKLATALNLVVFARGITDLKTEQKLKKCGYLYGQGSYFSPEMSAEAMTVLLSKSA